MQVIRSTRVGEAGNTTPKQDPKTGFVDDNRFYGIMNGRGTDKGFSDVAIGGLHKQQEKWDAVAYLLELTGQKSVRIWQGVKWGYKVEVIPEKIQESQECS
jgi:hypothetical protein